MSSYIHVKVNRTVNISVKIT